MSNNKQVGIHFGAFTPKFKVQLKKQGFEPKDAELLKRHQKYAEYILHLTFNGILSDTETKKAQSRLFKAIIKNTKQTTKQQSSR